MTTYDKIYDQLDYLKLPAFKDYIAEQAKSNMITNDTLQFIEKMFESQAQTKRESSIMYNVKVAAFPKLKYLDDFDFNFQPTISRDQIDSMLAGDILSNTENILFIGSPGVGKTHLSTAIGIEIAKQRNAVYFIKFSKLIRLLKEAHTSDTFDRRIKAYNKYKLLIIDELGFNEISELEAKLFFQLVDSRYEYRSIIITSNVEVEKWDKVFGDSEMITRAILDRLLHHSYIYNITGKSYRLKDKILTSVDEMLE